MSKTNNPYDTAVDALKNGRTPDDIREELTKAGTSSIIIDKVLKEAIWAQDSKNVTARHNLGIVLLLPMVLWAAGFFLPGFIVDTGKVVLTIPGGECLLYGFGAFWQPALPIASWYANLFFFAVVLGVLRTRVINAQSYLVGATVGAVLASLTLFVTTLPLGNNDAELSKEHPAHLGLGGYLWISAIVILFIEILAYYLWQKSRKQV